MRKRNAIKNFNTLLLVSFLLILNFGCPPSGSSGISKPTTADEQYVSDASSGPQVIAVAYPLKYLTQRIAGASIEVALPFADDVIASQWRPGRDDVVKLQQAKLIVANGRGATFAKWLNSVSIPESRLCISATRGMALADYISVEDMQTVHSHGPEGEHSHPRMVAFTWLDPKIVGKQANYIAQELTRVFPKQGSSFEENLRLLHRDLDELTGLLGRPATDPPQAVLTSNPDLKFFTRAANLQDQHLHWFEPPSMESARNDLENLLKDDDMNPLVDERKRVLLLTFPLPPNLETLMKEKNIVSVDIEMMDSVPSGKDYLAVMMENIEKLDAALAGSGKKPTIAIDETR